MYLNGSTYWFNNNNAYITQYDAYLPYGELLVDEHSSSEEMPYKFNGNGDFDMSDGVSIAFSIGDFFIDKMINKVIPGVEAPSMEEITKALYNGLLKKGKLNLRSDFNLGKEILKQGASLKMQVLEMVTDKVIEHEEEPHENNSHKEANSNNK